MKYKAIFMVVLSVLMTVSYGQASKKKFLLSGVVTDVRNIPVVGALITIDGMNTNIVTDKNGNYRVRVRPDADSITVVTFNNGISTASIKGKTTINFILGGVGSSKEAVQTDSDQDDKVRIGYGEVSKKNLVTPVTKIDARNNKYASYKNIYEILKGTPGVIVNGNSIKIQGQSSFNSGTEPLFVIDGMVVESIDGISPSMVESISILKGASTAIYGSRGTNGVIIISLINGSEKTR